MTSKTIFILSLIAILTFSFIFSNHNVKAQLNNNNEDTRYIAECNYYIKGTLDDYLKQVVTLWDYNLTSMPKSVYDNYICMNTVNLQEKGEQKFNELGNAMMNGENSN